MRADSRGVTSVIGVILMVAVAVILAAVVATFALGTTEDLSNTGPQAIIEVSDAPDDFGFVGKYAGGSYSGGENPNEEFVNIAHEGGDPLKANEITLSIRETSTNNLIAEWTGKKWDTPSVEAAYFKSTGYPNNLDSSEKFDSNPFSSGDSIIVVIKDPEFSPTDQEYTIQITHKATQTLITKQTVEVN